MIKKKFKNLAVSCAMVAASVVAFGTVTGAVGNTSTTEWQVVSINSGELKLSTYRFKYNNSPLYASYTYGSSPLVTVSAYGCKTRNGTYVDYTYPTVLDYATIEKNHGSIIHSLVYERCHNTSLNNGYNCASAKLGIIGASGGTHKGQWQPDTTSN